MFPTNVKTTKKDLIRRMKGIEQNNSAAQEKISPEVEKMTEGMIVRWKKTGVTFSSTAPIKEYPTQAETQAARLLDFTTVINDDKPRSKRWTNQS